MRLRRPAPTTRRSRPRRGLALAEVIVAGVILAIGLTSIVSITAKSLSMQTNGEKRMTAAWLADDLLNMVVVEGPDEFAKHNDTSGGFDAPFDAFTFQVDIKSPSTAGVPYRVTATVAWEAPTNPAVVVETLVALRRYRLEDDKRDQREPYEPLDREARLYENEVAAEGGR